MWETRMKRLAQQWPFHASRTSAQGDGRSLSVHLCLTFEIHKSLKINRLKVEWTGGSHSDACSWLTCQEAEEAPALTLLAVQLESLWPLSSPHRFNLHFPLTDGKVFYLPAICMVQTIALPNVPVVIPASAPALVTMKREPQLVLDRRMA